MAKQCRVFQNKLFPMGNDFRRCSKIDGHEGKHNLVVPMTEIGCMSSESDDYVEPSEATQPSKTPV